MAPRTDPKELDIANNNSNGDENESEPENGNLVETFQEDDAETEELARLRCESVTLEEKRQIGKELFFYYLYWVLKKCCT